MIEVEQNGDYYALSQVAINGVICLEHNGMIVARVDPKELHGLLTYFIVNRRDFDGKAI